MHSRYHRMAASGSRVAQLLIRHDVLEAPLSYTAVWTEPGSTVRYPPGLERLPLKRGEYYYYAARVHAVGKSVGVLVRRPKNITEYPACAELFAAVNVTALFGLQPDRQVIVELDSVRSPLKIR